MKDNYIFDVLDLIDDRHIYHSITTVKKSKRVSPIPKISIIAACFVLVVTMAFMIPYSKNTPPIDITPLSSTDNDSFTENISATEDYESSETIFTVAEEYDTSNEEDSTVSDVTYPDTDQTVDTYTYYPVDIYTAEPTEVYTETLTEITVVFESEDPSELITERPTEATTAEPIKEPTETYTEEPTETYTEEPTATHSQETTETSSIETTNDPYLDEPFQGSGPFFESFSSAEEFVEWVESVDLDGDTTYCYSWRYVVNILRKQGSILIPESVAGGYELDEITIASNDKSIELRFSSDANEGETSVKNELFFYMSFYLGEQADAYTVNLIELEEKSKKEYFVNFEDFIYKDTMAEINGRSVNVYYSNFGKAQYLEQYFNGRIVQVYTRAVFNLEGYSVRIQMRGGLVNEKWDNAILENFNFKQFQIQSN